jgi:DNA-binding response OmpR family regulator
MKLLIVDDDTEFLDTLGYVLRREGYEIVTAADGQQGLRQWEATQPDMVLLDRVLPKVDGFEVCREIRHRAKTPVIMISGRQSEEDRVRGLQLGADDYLSKPFGNRELCARIDAVLRRSNGHGQHTPAGEVRVGDLVLSMHAYKAAKSDLPIHFTRTEFRILSLLALNVGQIVPHNQLIQYAWGYHDEGNSSLLKTHVSHLRKKLRQHWHGSLGIESMVNVGYRLLSA